MKRIIFYHNVTGKELEGTFFMEEKDGITHYFKRIGRDMLIEINPRDYTNYNIELYNKQ